MEKVRENSVNIHPNPQFARSSFESLNGEWEFKKGTEIFEKGAASTIVVPFCPESCLSGIGDTELFTDCVYAKDFYIAKERLEGRIFLRFGGVDYYAQVYINGSKAGEHRGGYTPFQMEITDLVREGENRIVLFVHDDVRENTASGKQSSKPESYGCFYTRMTGIWQSVWLEYTPKNYVKTVRFFPSAKTQSVKAELTVEGQGKAEITVFYQGKEVGKASGELAYRKTFDISLSEKHLWEVGKGELYDVLLAFEGDEVESYFGLRDVEMSGRKFLLNGKSVFQRMVLDQGVYPDGIYTAPSEEAMIKDIQISLDLGFNGARLHQKLFEPRFLYHCDRMGYMVWGEYASWGLCPENLDGFGQFICEWTEAVERDFNHPSIVAWCPLNEMWENLAQRHKVRDIRFVEGVYAVTKALDDTRPCIDTSGGYHGRYTDIFDVHCYYAPEKFVQEIDNIDERGIITMDKTYAPESEGEEIVYDGKQPIHVSEYGGTAYVANANGWGYKTAASEEAFVEEYIALTKRVMQSEKIFGLCYTQLYDIEQEQNGLYTKERLPKLSQKGMDAVRACNQAIAEIEK